MLLIPGGKTSDDKFAELISEKPSSKNIGLNSFHYYVGLCYE